MKMKRDRTGLVFITLAGKPIYSQHLRRMIGEKGRSKQTGALSPTQTFVSDPAIWPDKGSEASDAGVLTFHNELGFYEQPWLRI